MKKILLCLLSAALILSLNSMGAFAEEYNRENTIRKPRDFRDQIDMGLTHFGAVVTRWIGSHFISEKEKEAFQNRLPNLPNCLNKFSASSDFCLAKDVLESIRKAARGEKTERLIIRVAGGTGRYDEFLKMKERAETFYKRKISFEEFGTSQQELDRLLNTAYQRESCNLYRKAKKTAHFGDAGYLTTLKSEFDEFSKKVAGTMYAVKSCRLSDYRFEAPSEANWKKLKLPYYEKLSCGNLRVARKGSNEAAVKMAVKEYRSLVASMKLDGLALKKECQATDQQLKTLLGAPLARRIARSLQQMNKNLALSEQEIKKLENAKDDAERELIEKQSEIYTRRAEKAAAVYNRATKRFQTKEVRALDNTQVIMPQRVLRSAAISAAPESAPDAPPTLVTPPQVAPVTETRPLYSDGE